MLALKITLEGLTTSFRYPHFMLGVQPTYEMPPPATIYGHLCSTLGEWIDPAGVQFAYHFTFERKLLDLEHVHVLSPSGGKLPGTGLPKVLEGNVNPFQREILFMPRLVLYLNKPEWESAFRSPRYAVSLGRSQDLCAYTDVRVIDLAPRGAAYFEHTLMPFEYPLRSPQGVVLQMPRFLDYTRGRAPVFGRYSMIKQRVTSRQMLAFGGQAPDTFLVDPDSPESAGLNLGLIFLSFV